jgi:hypothetical protein
VTVIAKPIQQYLAKHAEIGTWEFIAKSGEGIDQVVVIPALAERDVILETLRRLSANPLMDLKRTLVICVVNNRRRGIANTQDIENNQQTIEFIRSLIDGKICAASMPAGQIERQSREIISSGIRLACVDASSPGMEMPDKSGGVGLARKLGLDIALSLFDGQNQAKKLLFNLDADTWVEPHYLSAVRHFFENRKTHAAVVQYAHQQEDDPALQAAICCYEIFLRYYVLGLRFAGSPYAFHSIGSTMVCTPASYAAVRGMNRREAAEDFYFLNKMAKLGPLSRIHTTTVFPSARPSHRVPFGTGQRMIRFLEGKQNEYLLYDPKVFTILKCWLEMMGCVGRQQAQSILAMAARIDPLLTSFLESNRFQEVWPRIQRNHRKHDALIMQFHVWFDGFKTMKLVHYLTEHGFPQGEMFTALKNLFEMMGIRCPVTLNGKTRSNLGEQIQVLKYLRQCESPNISLT